MSPPPSPAAAVDFEREHQRLVAAVAGSEAPRAAALARQAQQAGAMDWAVRLLLQAARIWSLNAQGSRGLVCLQRAAALARRHCQPADLARVELERGRQLGMNGHQHKALRVLVGLLRTPQLAQQMPPGHRSNAWLLLASLASEIDPDAELRCLQAAARACGSEPGPALRSCVGSEAQAWLRRWAFSADCFDGMLLHPPRGPGERQRSLAQAVAGARRLPALTDPQAPVQRMMTRVVESMVEAAAERQASRLFAAARALQDAQVAPRGYAYSMLILALAVALALDDLDVALRLHAQLEPMDEECRHIEPLNVYRQLIELGLARRQGDPRRALEQYQLYATAWAQRLRSIDLRPSELLQGVDEALSAAPRADEGTGETTGEVPPWLAKAREVIQASGLQPLAVEELASRVQVPVRTLREGFRRHLGVHPRKVLEDARLDALHAIVGQGALASKSLAELAALAGYSHPSRLSRAYAARFGVRLVTRRGAAPEPAPLTLPRRAPGGRSEAVNEPAAPERVAQGQPI